MKKDVKMNYTVFIENSKPIKLCGEDVIVRNPKFRSVLQFAKECRPLLNKLMSLPLGKEGGRDTIDLILELAADEETWHTLCICASTCTDKPPEFFKDIDVNEVTLLVEELSKKVDWRSLKQLFLKAIPSLNLAAAKPTSVTPLVS